MDAAETSLPSTENQSLPEEINSVSASIVNQQVVEKNGIKTSRIPQCFPKKLFDKKCSKTILIMTIINFIDRKFYN